MTQKGLICHKTKLPTSEPHIPGHLHYLHPYFFGNFYYDFRCKYFHYILDKINAVAEKYFLMICGTFFCFKALYFDWFVRWLKSFWHGNLVELSCILLSHSGSLLQNIMISYENEYLGWGSNTWPSDFSLRIYLWDWRTPVPGHWPNE